jgi:hypothetical protein
MILWPYVFGKICVFILVAEHDAFRTRDSVLSIETGLRAVRYVARISVGQGDVFLLLSLHTFCGSHPASSSMGAGVPSLGYSGQDVDVTCSTPCSAEVKR